MNFSVDDLPEERDERIDYVQDWVSQEGLEVTQPSVIELGEEYSLPEMLGMSTNTGNHVIDTLVFIGEEGLDPELQSAVSVDPRDDDPGLSPTITPSDLEKYWSFQPYTAESHAEANIPGNDTTQYMLDEFGGLMMTEMKYDGQKVADVLLGPVLDSHRPYDSSVNSVLREESAAIGSAASRVLGERVETAEDMQDLDILFYETSEVPVDDDGNVTTGKPAVVSWYEEDDQLYLVPERISAAVGDDENTEEAYIGAVRGGYVDLGGGSVHAPLPPFAETGEPFETEQNYFTTLHNIE